MPRPIHFEIQADDAERAMTFYTQLFGWQFAQWGQEKYWLITTGEKSQPGIDGGLLPRRGPTPVAMAAVNAFVCTVDVANLDSTLEKAQSLGGMVVVPKTPVPTVGWLGYAKDTEGNIFGMMQMDAKAA